MADLLIKSGNSEWMKKGLLSLKSKKGFMILLPAIAQYV